MSMYLVTNLPCSTYPKKKNLPRSLSRNGLDSSIEKTTVHNYISDLSIKKKREKTDKHEGIRIGVS